MIRYADYHDFVIEHLKSKGDNIYNGLVKSYAKAYGYDLDTQMQLIEEEMVADNGLAVFTDEKAMTKLAKNNRTLLEKIHDFFNQFIDKLKAIKAKLSKSSAVYATINQDIDYLEQSADKIRTMLDDVENTNVQSNQRLSLDVEVSKTDFESNIKKVVNMKSVADLDGTEFSKGDTDLVTQVTDYFNSIGNEVDSKYGTIKLTRTGVKSSVAHGIGRNKAIAFKAVPDVLKNGEIIDYTENYKNRGYDTAVFSAPFSINNEPFYMAAVVIADDKVNEYYLHEVVIEKQNEDETPFKTGTSQKTTPSDASSSIYTLLEKLQNVNTKYSKNTLDSEGNELTEQQREYFKDSKVRDDDGNLQVVYHGTSEDFTVFDKTKGRSNMDIQGMFFSPWELDAQGYGSNVKAYYLNITNPADEQTGYKALRKFQGQNNAGVKAREYLESLGYDGVNNENEEYIAFNSNQIKLTDNLNPTDKSDIRYSKDTDVDEFEQLEYNYPKIRKAEYNKLRSEALTWDSDKINQICMKNLNGFTYIYSLDSAYNLDILGKYKGLNIHERKEIGNVDRNGNTISSKSKVFKYTDGNNLYNNVGSKDRRTTASNDKFSNQALQSKGNSDGAGSFENDYYDNSSKDDKQSRNTRLTLDDNIEDVNEAFLSAVMVLQNVHIDDIDLSSEVVNKAEKAAKHIQDEVKKSGYRTQKLTGKGSVRSIATEPVFILKSKIYVKIS